MPEEDECFSSSSDSSGTDEDEEMRKALELSLQDVPSRTNTTPQDEEKDLQEALRLSLESAFVPGCSTITCAVSNTAGFQECLGCKANLEVTP